MTANTFHIGAHLGIFLGYVAAMVLVPQRFSALIHISKVTIVAGAGFFLFCGLTHFGIAIEKSYDTFFTVTDHLQAICIWTFLLSLARDLSRALTRLARVFALVGDDTARLVAGALQDTLEPPDYGDR